MKKTKMLISEDIITYVYLITQRAYPVEEEFLQSLRHDDHILPWLVVHVTIGEHGVEVLYTFLRWMVVVWLETFFDGAQIHRLFDNFMVILEIDKYALILLRSKNILHEIWKV